MWDVCQKYGGARMKYIFQHTKGMRKQDEKLDSRAAKKGAKKLVISDCTKILEKESSNPGERNLWENNVYSL